MSITQVQKSKRIREFRRTESDTGSPEVQSAILTERINNLTAHLKTHSRDHASRRGLLILVSRRRRLLDYLSRTSPDTYRDVISRLNLRK